MSRCTLCKYLFLWWLFLVVAPVFASVHDSVADSLMAHFFTHRAEGYYKAGELFGNLYVKQRVGVFKNNLALNAFPDMTRFDKFGHIAEEEC